MSFSSGVFSINSTGQPVVTGTVISSTVFNDFTADIATGLSTCVLKDGTQTITANIPMSSFKFTGLAAGTASGNSLRYEQVNGVVTTAGDILYATGAGALSRLAIGTARQQLATNSGATAPEWVASMQSILTTTGDTIQTTAANTPARLPATASVAAHATTSDIWTARETVLTGIAVTFTDISDAPYVGAVAWVYQNATHTWTDGAVFDVQGNANYTATIGDWVRINAVTVSTFDVAIFKADGTAVAGTNKMLQLVAATKTDTFGLASATFTDITGLTVTTAALASTGSKVRITVTLGRVSINIAAASTVAFRLMRDSTPIGIGDAASLRIQTSFIVDVGRNLNYSGGGFTFIWYDSPAAASAFTYKLQMATEAAAQGYINRNYNYLDETIVYSGVSASSITAEELSS